VAISLFRSVFWDVGGFYTVTLADVESGVNSKVCVYLLWCLFIMVCVLFFDGAYAPRALPGAQ
jgi:hypothetical protein